MLVKVVVATMEILEKVNEDRLVARYKEGREASASVFRELCVPSLLALFTMSSTIRVEDLASVYASKSWIPTNSRMHLGVPTPSTERISKWNTGPGVGSKEFSSYPDQTKHLVSFLSTKNCQPMWQILVLEQYISPIRFAYGSFTHMYILRSAFGWLKLMEQKFRTKNNPLTKA